MEAENEDEEEKEEDEEGDWLPWSKLGKHLRLKKELRFKKRGNMWPPPESDMEEEDDEDPDIN